MELFDCKFSDGRAQVAPKTRQETTQKRKMAEMVSVIEDTSHPYMPHTLMTEAELNVYFPPVVVPEAVDAGDPFENAVDATLESGMRTVDELVKALGEQGRRRNLK